MTDEDVIRHRVVSGRWSIFSKKLPKEEIIFFAQVFLIYIVVIVCLINLSITSESQSVWSTLLSGSIGYLLPAPKISKKKNDPFLSNSPIQ